MGQITDLRKIRRDGLIIDEHFDAAKWLIEGGSSDIVIRIQWRHGDQLVELHHASGMGTYLVRDRSAIAVMIGNGDDPFTDLSVYNPDGSKRLSVSNTQTVNGRVVTGRFVGFIEPLVGLPTAFAFVLEYEATSCSDPWGKPLLEYRFDVDSRDGSVHQASDHRW